VHFFSRRFFEVLGEQKKGLTLASMAQTLGWQMPPEDPEGLALAWVAELDRYGIGRAALIASVPGDEASVSAAASAHPNRFYGYFMVNPLAADAVKRVQGALDAGVMRGICLFPAMHRFNIQDEAARSILDVVAATRPATVVFVHCGVLTVGVRKRLGIPSLFDMRFSNPIDLHGIALRYPQIRFVVPHFGAGYFREALMLADLCPNVYLDTSSSNRWMSYHASDVDLRTVFRRALDVVGTKRLLFGSDSSFFPRGWVTDVFRDQSKALYELGLSEDDARLIFGENLVHLLG
jgi:predicted TIM-barrel fold metal-dependent hydrolase